MASSDNPSSSTSPPTSIAITSPPTIDQMPQPGTFLGTPQYNTEEGLFEYPFPAPSLPTPPYLPPNASSPPPLTMSGSSSSSSVATPSSMLSISPKSGGVVGDSPVNTKITSKLVKEGPVPPGLSIGRRGSVHTGGNSMFNMTSSSS